MSGKVDYRHVYINFTNIEVGLDANGNNTIKTCPAALGPGFAAGTTDGPGVFGFQQGDTEVRAHQFRHLIVNRFYLIYLLFWGGWLLNEQGT